MSNVAHPTVSNNEQPSTSQAIPCQPSCSYERNQPLKRPAEVNEKIEFSLDFLLVAKNAKYVANIGGEITILEQKHSSSPDSSDSFPSPDDFLTLNDILIDSRQIIQEGLNTIKNENGFYRFIIHQFKDVENTSAVQNVIQKLWEQREKLSGLEKEEEYNAAITELLKALGFIE